MFSPSRFVTDGLGDQAKPMWTEEAEAVPKIDEVKVVLKRHFEAIVQGEQRSYNAEAPLAFYWRVRTDRGKAQSALNQLNNQIDLDVWIQGIKFICFITEKMQNLQ